MVFRTDGPCTVPAQMSTVTVVMERTDTQRRTKRRRKRRHHSSLHSGEDTQLTVDIYRARAF